MRFFIANIFILIFCISGAFAQRDLVKKSELQFSSDQEREAVLELLQGGDSYFEALGIIESVDENLMMAWKSGFDAHIDELITKPRRRDNWIYLNKVYHQLHRDYLVKYRDGANLSNTLIDGTYNCVSASAIYAMAFEKLQIPYVIKETPDHVYIIGESRRGPMQFETTDPVEGFRTFGYDFKKLFVYQLIAQKNITRQEFREKGMDSVFNQYYFKGREIGLKELVGIQYSNEGMLHWQKNEYKEAFNAFEKAYVIYPSKRISEFLFSSLVYHLQKSNYSDWYDVELLSRLPRYEQFDINYRGILADFDKVNQYYLIDHNDTEAIEKAYRLLRSELDERPRVELDYYYNYERARVFYNRGDYKSALDFVLGAFEVKPYNAEIELLLMNTFKQFLRAPDEELDIASRKLNAVIAKYPHLEENAKFGGLRLDFFLVGMLNAYHKKEIDMGDTLRERFLDLVNENPTFQFDPYIVGRAYSTAVYHYVESGEIPKANTLLSQGLNFAPFNAELINSKTLLEP